MQELSVFSRIASVLNVECVMWMWCRSWSLQIEVRSKQTAGEQGISPSVMKAKDSGMDCAPRGRKKDGEICYDWQRGKERERRLDSGWFTLFWPPHVLSPVICACVEEDVELIHPALARVHVTHRPCVCVCVVRGLPRSNRRLSPTVLFPLKTSSHSSTSAMGSRPRTSKSVVSLDHESLTRFRKTGNLPPYVWI